MNIGVDVDGVLSDLEGFQKEYAVPYFKRKFGLDVVNPDMYDPKDIFGCGKRQRDKFWRGHIRRYCVSWPARPGAARVLERLRSDGHNIVIITSRVFVTRKGLPGTVFRRMLFGWLRRNGIIYDQIELCADETSAKDKLEACIKHKIDYMLEDRTDNIKAISAVSRVIRFEAGYNKGYCGENTAGVKSFEEAYDIINGNLQVFHKI